MGRALCARSRELGLDLFLRKQLFLHLVGDDSSRMSGDGKYFATTKKGMSIAFSYNSHVKNSLLVSS